MFDWVLNTRLGLYWRSDLTSSKRFIKRQIQLRKDNNLNSSIISVRQSQIANRITNLSGKNLPKTLKIANMIDL